MACRIEPIGGASEEREVGVPEAAEREALLLARVAHHCDHLGMVGDGLHERHRAVRAEPAAERHLLVGRERLAAEEHDAVVEHGPADLGHLRVVELARQVDSRDHRTARAAELLDRDRAVLDPSGCGRNRNQGLDGSHAVTISDASELMLKPYSSRVARFHVATITILATVRER